MLQNQKNATPKPIKIPPQKKHCHRQTTYSLWITWGNNQDFTFATSSSIRNAFFLNLWAAAGHRCSLLSNSSEFFFYGYSLCLDKEGHSTPKYSVKWINIYSNRQMEKALFWQGAGRKISTSVLLDSCHFCRNQGICPRHFEQILLFLKNLFKQRNWFLRYLDRQDLTKSCPDGESRGSLTW